MSIMRLFIMLLATVALFGLPIWNLARLGGKKHILFGITPIVIFLSLFMGSQYLEAHSLTALYIPIKALSYWWLIVSLVIVGMSTIVMLLNVFFRQSKKRQFWAIVILTLLYVLIARINGERVVVKDLNLVGNPLDRSYHFVHITDLHAGSTDLDHAQKVVNKITKVDPEFVVITGDFIDEFHVERKDILPFNDLSMPVYLITGNHEFYLEPNKINEVIQDTKIQLIDGKKVEYEGLDIIGVSELSTVEYTLGSLGGVNTGRYTILLDHQPKEHEAQHASQSGVLLMLSGHTHRGQMWPMSLLMNIRLKYISGLYQIGNMFLYVNQGTGTLGPKLRFGTANEITSITLEPKIDK